MTSKVQKSEFTLQLSRTFQASRERVFCAWTDPEELKQWWGPEWCSCPEAEINLKIGGCYRFTMKDTEGEVYHLIGVFREVRPFEKLVYTWNCDHPNWSPIGETVVTIAFRERGDSTEVVVTHDLLPDAEAYEAHEKGWRSALGCLANHLTNLNLGEI